MQLEVELETLKYRLGSLRRAKSTTIIRREVEQVRVSSPKLGRRHSALSSPKTSMASFQETTPIRSVCHHGDLSAQLEGLRKQVSIMLFSVIQSCYCVLEITIKKIKLGNLFSKCSYKVTCKLNMSILVSLWSAKYN